MKAIIISILLSLSLIGCATNPQTTQNFAAKATGLTTIATSPNSSPELRAIATLRLADMQTAQQDNTMGILGLGVQALGMAFGYKLSSKQIDASLTTQGIIAGSAGKVEVLRPEIIPVGDTNNYYLGY